MKTLRIVIFAFICAAAAVSCNKKTEALPAPANNNNNNNGGGGGAAEDTVNNELCQSSVDEDSICEYPFYITPVFIPGGFYLGNDNGVGNGCATTVSLGIDSNVTAAYEGQYISIYWNYNSSRTWWGAAFNNEQNWSPLFVAKAGATKIKLDIKHAKEVKITLNAFESASRGQLVINKATSPVTPQWETIEVPITSVPTARFNAPLGIILEGFSGANGSVIEVHMRNIRIE
ncbi:MAG: hypothetical protein MUF42_11695 [Cytophagaceae bacterium]|jgi:hypothetical protein|nr:hypothetical protein [Cytophagaceae bacterium]